MPHTEHDVGLEPVRGGPDQPVHCDEGISAGRATQISSLHTLRAPTAAQALTSCLERFQLAVTLMRPRALQRYTMSARAAVRDSWLALSRAANNSSYRSGKARACRVKGHSLPRVLKRSSQAQRRPALPQARPLPACLLQTLQARKVAAQQRSKWH